jgi:hypothetical protein
MAKVPPKPSSKGQPPELMELCDLRHKCNLGDIESGHYVCAGRGRGEQVLGRTIIA